MDAATDQIVTRLDQTLRELLRRSPGWSAEFRKAKRARRPTIWAILGATIAVVVFVPLMAFAAPLAIIGMLANFGGIDLLLGLAGLAATAGSLLLASALRAALEQSRTLSVFSHLPIEDERIARRLWWTVPGLACVGLWFMGLAYGYVAWSEGCGLFGWLMVLSLAVAQWATAVAVATALLLSRPRWPYGELCVGLFALTGALVAGLAVNPLVVRGPVVTELLYRVIPAGWISGALGNGFLGGRLEAWWGLVPIVLLVATTPATMRRLAGLYEVQEYSYRPDAEAQATIVGWLGPATADTEDDPAGQPLSVEERLNSLLAGRERPLPPATVVEQIRQREFLERRDWTSTGIVERVAAAILTERERTIIDFLTGGRPGWTQAWAMMLVWLPIAIVVSLIGFVGPWIVFHVLGWASISAVAVGPWRGCSWRACGGTFLPHFAIVPIEYREAARAMFKVGLVRCLFVLPILMIVALYLAKPANVRPETAVIGTLAVVGLLILGLPLVSTSVLSAGLRMPTMNRWTWLLVFVPVVLTLAALGGVGVALVGLMGGGLQWTAGGLAVAAASILGLNGFFSLAHRRGRVDLASTRLSSFEQKAAAMFEKAERARLRGDVAREQYGRLWWLRRDLRRWAARTE